MSALDLAGASLPAPAGPNDARVQALAGRTGAQIQVFAGHAIRYAFVVILLWYGALKFTPYEANAIQGLVSNSFLLGWLYNVLTVQTVAQLIGTFEIATGLLIALRPVVARAAALGALMAIATFTVTLSFLFTTPGVIEPGNAFPLLSVLPGQFLIKDLALFAIAVWVFGDALKHWAD